jgi:hypothetical protein
MTQFPRHDIDPALKGREWCMQMAKAVWDSPQAPSIFHKASARYDEIKDYVMGRQSVSRYKPLLGIDEAEDESWMNIDWSIRPVAAKFRDIAIAKILQRKFNIIATPIDQLAKDDADKYFADIKTKIMMREQLMEINPELAQSPGFKSAPGEPEDLEELKMKMDYGFKHNMAIEMEQGIDLLLYQNDIKERRKRIVESIVDYGPGAYKEWIDARGRVKFRDVDISNLVTSFCRKGDFSDLQYAGELVEIDLADLTDYFTSDELKEIGNKAGAQKLKQSEFNQSTDGMKVRVLDLEFYSYNTKVTRRRENEEGNVIYKKSVFANKNSDRKVTIGGKEVNQYITTEPQVIYKVKWIIDTDYCYDFGLMNDMKRKKSDKAKTELSYHIYASNFDKMRAQGLMEKLIPLIDEYVLTVYRIQNFKNRWIPYIIDVDLDSLENIALGKGGANLTPKAVLDMAFQNFILPSRKKDISSQNINYKSVEIRPTGMAAEFQVLANDLVRILQDMRDVTGLNEYTDGSTPPERTLSGGIALANESTNNALFPFFNAEKSLIEKLSKALIIRLIQAVKKGKVEGVVDALGDGTIKFITVSPDISLYDWGMKIEDKPTDQDIQYIMEQLNIGETQGLLEPEDLFTIRNMSNLKQMEQMLAYRVKKRKKEKQQEAMQLQNANAQVQMQSAQAAEQSKQQTLAMEYKMKFDLMNAEKEWDYKIAELKVEGAAHAKYVDAGTKITTQQMANEQPAT